MDKKSLSLLGAMMLTSLGASPVYADHEREQTTNHAGHQVNGQTYTDYARVTHVESLFTYVTVREPQRRCEIIRPIRRHHNDRHHHRRNNGHRHHHRNNHSAAFIGGVIGGAIGHHVTRSVNGSSRLGATVAGAAIGSTLAGHAASNTSHQRNNPVLGHVDRGHNRHRNHHTYSHRDRPRKHCVTTTVSRQERRRDGYNVTYVYRGQTFQTHTEHHPGDHIRVRVQIRPH